MFGKGPFFWTYRGSSGLEILFRQKKQEVKIRAILVKALRVIQLTLMRINAPLNALLGRNRPFVP